MKNRRQQFGLWTMELGYAGEREHSAFWRPRLGRLSALARGRLGRRGALLLCILAGAVSILPRVHLEQFAEAQQPADKMPAAEKPAAAEKQPFTATFSNGVTVQLIGLSMNPSQGQPWWTPDGMKLPEAPYDRVPAIVDPGQGGIAREICFRWLNVPNDPDFEKSWGVRPESSGGGGGVAFDDSGKQIEGLTAWAAVITGTPKTCTLRFEVCVRTSPWSVAFTSKGDVGGTTQMADGVRQSALFAKPQAIGGDTLITVTHQIPGKATRLLAIDKDDNVHLASSATGGGLSDFEQKTYKFAGVTPDQIQRYDLQIRTREFEAIEFRDVSLDVEQVKEVKTVRISPDGKEERLDVPGLSAAALEQMKNSPEAKAWDEWYQKSLVLLKTLADKDDYKLEQDQSVKHLPPPFPAARQDYWKAFHIMPNFNGMSRAAQEDLLQGISEPGFMILRWSDKGLERMALSNCLLRAD